LTNGKSRVSGTVDGAGTTITFADLPAGEYRLFYFKGDNSASIATNNFVVELPNVSSSAI
jgi:hypothetical protein